MHLEIANLRPSPIPEYLLHFSDWKSMKKAQTATNTLTAIRHPHFHGGPLQSDFDIHSLTGVYVCTMLLRKTVKPMVHVQRRESIA